jgi:uncharacterized protein YndB with AHSA1/START domain
MTVHQHVVDGRPALRLARHLEHSVERVWRAVSEPAELAKWPRTRPRIAGPDH